MRKFLLIGATAAMAGALGSYAALADNQPHMQNALASLQRARTQLHEAAEDKGGHRAKAIELVDAAIAQVREGIKFANAH